MTTDRSSDGPSATGPRGLVSVYLASVMAGDGAATDHLDPEVVLTVRGRHPLAGRYVGVAAFSSVLGAMAEHMSLRGIDEILGGDRTAAVVASGSVSIDGETIGIRRLVLYTVEGGRIVAIDIFEDDQDLIDRVLSDGSGSDQNSRGGERR